MPAILVPIGGWIARALLGASVQNILRGIAGLIIRQLAIKAILLAVLAAVWSFLMGFAEEVFIWYIETSFEVFEWAMEQLGFPDIFLQFMQAIEGMPEGVVRFLATVGVFNSIEFLFSCHFANRALRQIPIIGRSFAP